MEHLSAHGLLFVALQLVVVAALAAVIVRHHARAARRGGAVSNGRPLLAVLVFLAWYGVLRVQPVRRGADPFGFTLGVFDGVSLAGALFLLSLHWILLRMSRLHAASVQ